MRSIDCRRSRSRSEKDSAAQAGLTPVASWSSSRKSSSLNVSIPQSVWWMRMISCVPSLCCEIASERIVSSVTTPPAFRMTCASPSFSPRTFVGISRASMHATTASLRPGGIGRSPLSKLEEYCSALRRTSSVVLIGWTLLRPRRVVLRVDLREALPLVGQLVLREARVHGAGLDARVAVDALLGIDVELLDRVVVGLVRRRVDAVHRAHLDAGVVLGADARLRDHVGHARKHRREARRPSARPGPRVR